MSQYNHISLLGTVDKEPVVKTLPSGSSLCEFTLVSDESYTSKAGAKVVSKLYIGVVMTEYVLKKLEKQPVMGDLVLIEGYLKYSSWEAEGVKRNKHQIMCSNLVLLESNGKTEQPSKIDAIKKVFPKSVAKTPQDDGVDFTDELPF